ncbi:MAG TPA: DUF5335 family protein [Polyangia bacterium]|nr:DUF5335 family protein [Polyangia bacterium]
MSTTRKLSRGDWEDYFDDFTRKFLKEDTPGAASIEVISPTLGDQFEVSAVRLLGLTYDPKSQALEVALEGVDHLIFNPAEIWILEGDPGFISTLEVVHSDGVKEIIYVRRTGPRAPRYQPPTSPSARANSGAR